MHSKSLKRNKRTRQNKMKYTCKNCDFKWNGNSDTFDKVLGHEKTHRKGDLD